MMGLRTGLQLISTKGPDLIAVLGIGSEREDAWVTLRTGPKLCLIGGLEPQDGSTCCPLAGSVGHWIDSIPLGS